MLEKTDISYRRNKTCHCIHCPVPEKWCSPKSGTDSWNSKDLVSTCHLWQIPENIVYFTSQSKFPSVCQLCVYIHAVYKIYKLQNSKYDNMHGGFVDRYAMIWIVEIKLTRDTHLSSQFLFQSQCWPYYYKAVILFFLLLK